MLTNYLKITWRNLLNGGWYSAINIGGLAVVLAVSVLLIWWIKNEFSYDRFHADSERIYRVNTHTGSGADDSFGSLTPAPIAVAASKGVTGVEEAVRLTGIWDFNNFRVGDQLFSEQNESLGYADENFLSVFDGFRVIQGNASNPFPAPNSIVLTESMARKFFGTIDAVGKTLTVADTKKVFTVGTVLADIPEQSSIRYQIFFPMGLLKSSFGGNGEWKVMDDDWGNFYFDTYLKLQPGTSPAQVARTLTSVQAETRKNVDPANLRDYKLQSFTSVHLYNADGESPLRQQVRMMGMVALLLLVIGCINFVNLSTARAARRAQEVGVRKIAGARTRQLTAQLLVEYLLTLGLALSVALLIMYALEPYYQDLTGKTLNLSLLDPQLWLLLSGMLTLTLLLAGLYPAVMVASFDPVRSLRGKMGDGNGQVLLRKGLVVMQFVLSTGLIVGTLVIGGQLNFIRERDPGFDKAHTFTFRSDDRAGQFQRELAAESSIRAVTTSSNNLWQVGAFASDSDWDGKDPGRTFSIGMLGVDARFIPTYEIQLVAGKNFSGTLADSTAVILNESAVKQMGLRNPIGRRFSVQGTEGQIVGVVKDFDTESIRTTVKPLVMYSFPQYNTIVHVKTTGGKTSQAIASTERLWKKFNPEYPFEYTFVDEAYNRLYQSEERIGQLFNFFSGIAILISCLGLFGLATFTAEQRTKEIGIRKVLGASVTSIVALLSKDFLKLVLIAIVIATPIAWYAMNEWLADFAYKIDISWWVFALAGGLAVGITLLTVSFQSVKAALMNPVESLRSE